MSNPSAAAPRRRDRTATRAALLDAARLRFARDGFDGVGVRDIAADVGVDPALVFRYFGSKEKLFAQATATDERAAAAPGGAADDLPTELLRSVVSTDWSQYAGEHPFVAMLRSSGHDAARTQLHQQVCDAYVARLADLVEGPDRELRAEMLSALLLGISVARSVVRTPALHNADFAALAPYFDQIAALLLGRQSDAPGVTPNE